MLLEFAMELAVLQHSEGRIFLFEHPSGADSWNEESVVKVKNMSDVHEIRADWLNWMVFDACMVINACLD